MGRSPCCSKLGLMRGPWSTKEDTLLINYIQQHGEGKWRDLPKKAGLLRCGKSCRLRWMNYLRPGIKRGNIREEEEDLIVRLHGLLGNRWSLIAGRLPGRTDNEIKNYWNTHLLKKLTTAGVRHKDPPLETEKFSVRIAGKKKSRKKTSKDEKNAARRMDLAPPRTKVYLPKPIRISPAFSRSSSHDCLTSADTSSGGGGKAAEVASCVPVEIWPPLVEVEDAAVYGDGGGDDYIGGEYMLPVVHSFGSVPGDVEMLEKVYDEYLQLLSCRSIE